MRWWLGVAVVIIAAVLIAAAPVSRLQKGNSRVAVPARPGGGQQLKIDARVEAVARAICRARGIDPDYVGSPYPPGMPVWRFFAPDAALFVEEFDALKEYEQ